MFLTKNLLTPKLPTNKIINENDLIKNIFDKEHWLPMKQN